MITVKNNVFHLATASSSYVFLIDGRGIAEHLYYGPRLRFPERDLEVLRVKRIAPRSGEASLGSRDWEVNLNDTPLEISTPSGGDFRTPLVALEARKNCSASLDLRYRASETFRGMKRMECGLPQAIGGEDEAHGVRLDFQDADAGIIVSLYYTVWEASNTITRRTVIRNTGSSEATLAAAASLQLDLFESDWNLTLFGGPWGREMRSRSQALSYGTVVNESRNGFCGQKSPFISLERKNAAIIIGLMYCGDHRETVETGPYGKTHIVAGINSETIRITLKPGEVFETPEAFMTLSKDAETASRDVQAFQENHIMRGTWKNRLRPVAFNTSKAMGLEVKQDRVLEQIKLASQLGFELFTLDDGWFGVRNDKADSIGDWAANPMKLPSGLASISKACHKAGLLFGLWVSPECVSLQSRLAIEHPDWLVRNPRKKDNPIEDGQFLVDLTRAEVYEYMLDLIKNLVERTGIDCLRWSLGTQMSDIWSRTEEPSLSGSWRHRYVCALYRMQRSLSLSFPNLLIENTWTTSARFDAGLLASSALVCPSTVSDPFEQLEAIAAASRIITPSAISNQVALRRWNLEGRYSSFSTAFNIACFGTPAYSLDLKKLTHEERQAIAEQISFYKQYRSVFQFGSYSVRDDGNRLILTATSPEKETIVALLAVRNMKANGEDDILYLEGADEASLYQVSRRGEEEEVLIGEHYAAPPLEGETYIAGGDTLKYAGLRLAQPYLAGSYSEEMRVMGDHSTRLYVARKLTAAEN